MNLGNSPRSALSDEVVCRRPDLWSGRASTSAGIELMHNEVIAKADLSSTGRIRGARHIIWMTATLTPPATLVR